MVGDKGDFLAIVVFEDITDCLLYHSHLINNILWIDFCFVGKAVDVSSFW